MWVLLILLFSPIGAIVWFVAGRPQTRPVGQAGPWRPGSGFPEYQRPRTSAPDDDPEFLRTVDSEQSRIDREILAQWEKDFGDDDK